MAQTQKIVHVPDVGVVAFPGDLEDDHVKRLIKSFREKKDQPKITEESEHARQLKPAQSLSTAIPKLPAWANTPLVSDKDLEETPAGQALTAKSQAEFAKAHPKIEATLEKANTPVVLSGLQGVKEFTQGMLTPANMALMLGAPESKILSGIFATQAMRGSYSDAKAAQKAFEAGNNPEAIKYATQALLGLGVGVLAGTHAYKGLPETLRGKLASEEGTLSLPSGKQPRSYEAVQKDIDDAEDELEKSGAQVTNLYFPEHADVLSKAEGWKPMPENLVKLYAERDAIGSGQLKQSIGEIKSNLEKAGIKNDAEIRHVLEYYALDPNRTDAAKQYLAAEHTQAMVDQPVKRQLEQAYISLASERGIPMDDEDDLWRDRKTTQDAIAAVKAIHSYFYPGTELNIKGILPEPKSDPLDDIKKKAEEVKARSQKAGPSQ